MGKSSYRTAFDGVADQYDEIRPRYPKELFDALARVTGLAADASILEIGPGTGQATRELAQRGYRITAVELGENLARLCAANLAPYPNVRVIQGAFERVRLPAHSFDLILAATAFHWVMPEKRYRKSHLLLKRDGHLAIIDTRHVSDGEGDAFFFATQPIYVKHKAGAERHNNFTLPKHKDLKAEEMDSEFFTPVFFAAFPIAIRYNARDYVRLLGTYSPVLAMEPPRRAAFLTEIEKLISERFDGHVTRHSVMTLTVGKRKG